MPNHTIAYTGRSVRETHAVLTALASQDLLAWEAGLIAATHAAGRMKEDLAQGWIELLTQWDTLSEIERIQQHVGLRLRIHGGALAALAPACLPSTLDDAELLVTLAQIEAQTPGRRLRSRIEPPPVQPAAWDASSIAQSDAIYAGVSLVALLSPATPVLEQWTADTQPTTSSCAAAYQQHLFALMLDPQADGAEHIQQLANASRAFAIDARWLWRIAVHRYLMGDTEGVRAASAYYQKHYPDDLESTEIMKVLADISSGTPNPKRTHWPDADMGSNPTYQWISAEAARVRGQVSEAEDALRRITDQDVHFVAAWISLAAARNALARGHGVHIALQTLEEIAPPLPIYDYWRTTLRARTQP